MYSARKGLIIYFFLPKACAQKWGYYAKFLPEFLFVIQNNYFWLLLQSMQSYFCKIGIFQHFVYASFRNFEKLTHHPYNDIIDVGKAATTSPPRPWTWRSTPRSSTAISCPARRLIVPLQRRLDSEQAVALRADVEKRKEIWRRK